MLSDNLLAELNKQINLEFFSAQMYLAMGAYCKAENLDGFANFFIVQAEEERFHAMKIFNFINTMGKRATITGFESPRNEFKSILETFEAGYNHEQFVTRRFYDLMDIAIAEREHATIGFLKWFIDEQVEEEDLFDSLIQKLKRIDTDSNAFFMLDNELLTRVFTPPANE
ncbi:ferritin [Paenibacillus sp. y28]|uniref:ferritin n=1 Tax=Paenibacillus sp. y28 TaxID=3129110 RepID=UPI0030196BA5